MIDVQTVTCLNAQRENACPCGEALQTRDHVLLECPHYEEYRNIFDKAEIERTTKAILGTDQGLAALSDFLTRSGAFTKTGRPRPEVALPTWEDELAREEREEEEEEEEEREDVENDEKEAGDVEEEDRG
jgi:hypothetical protein